MGDLHVEHESRGIKRARQDALGEHLGDKSTKKPRLEPPQGTFYGKVMTMVGGLWSWFVGSPASGKNSAMAEKDDEVLIVSESKGVQRIEASMPSILDQVVETSEVEVVRVDKNLKTPSFLTNPSTLGRFYGRAYNIATKEKRERDRRERKSEQITRHIRQYEGVNLSTIQKPWRLGNSSNRYVQDSPARKFLDRIRRQPSTEWQSIAAAYQKEDLDRYRKIYERVQLVPGPIIACITGNLSSRGSTPSKGLTAVTRSPFSIKETGAISKTQFSTSPGPSMKPASPVVITLYDEADQKDEEVVIVSSTEKEQDPEVQKIVEKYSSSIAKVREFTETPKRTSTLGSTFFSSKVCEDDFISELLSKYDVRNKVRDQQLQSETIKRDYVLEKADRLQANFEERLRKQLNLTEIIHLEDKEDEAEEELLPLITSEMKKAISKAMMNSTETIIEEYDIPIKRRDLETLEKLNWLNDSIINFYLQMVAKRSMSSSRYPKVYSFNTYFYSKVAQSGHTSVKRWTRKVDIFGYDLLVIPVHLKVHWCLATVDLRKKKISYYDSMNSDNYQCLNALESYLRDEHQDKKGSPLEMTCFTKINVKGLPQQQNGSDCGMFACKFAEYISRDAEIAFTQAEMPYYRERMQYEIITNTLLHP